MWDNVNHPFYIGLTSNRSSFISIFSATTTNAQNSCWRSSFFATIFLRSFFHSIIHSWICICLSISLKYIHGREQCAEKISETIQQTYTGLSLSSTPQLLLQHLRQITVEKINENVERKKKYLFFWITITDFMRIVSLIKINWNVCYTISSHFFFFNKQHCIMIRFSFVYAFLR